MMMRGTDAAGAIAAQARVERAEELMPQTRSPLLRGLRPFLSHEAASTLDRMLAGEFDHRERSTRGGRPGSSADPSAAQSPKRALERLINTSQFGELEAAHRATLLGAIAGTPRDAEGTKAAQRLVGSGMMSRLSSVERTQLVQLFDRLPSSERAVLSTLSERPLHKRSVLEDRDFEDTLLIAHLLALASNKLARPIADLGIKAEEVIALVLATLANPERIGLEEGADGVLSILEFGLAETSPAELARLWRELVSGDLVAELPSEGTIDLGKRLEGVDPNLGTLDTPLRMGLEAITVLARPKGSGSKDDYIMPGGHGIDADVVARTLGFLYGVGFTVASGAAGALRGLERVSSERFRVPPAFTSLLYDGGERLFLFDRIESGTVYFRAPHGTSTKPKGARRREPDRLIEDPATGLESLPLPLFKQLIGVALVPRT
jgi:hypothetical protein